MSNATLGGGPQIEEASGHSLTVRQDMEVLFDLALQGALPRARPLHSWEPQTLDANHLQMVMMKSCGIKQRRIAQEFKTTDSQVSIVVNHPDAQLLLARMMSYGATRVADIGQQMDSLLPISKLVLEDILYSEKASLALKAKVAFGILDRRGYGQVEKKEVDVKVSMPAEEARRLRTAFAEARELVGVNYRVYVGEPEDSPRGSGTASPGAGAPPAGNSQASTDHQGQNERVA